MDLNYGKAIEDEDHMSDMDGYHCRNCMMVIIDKEVKKIKEKSK